MAYPSTPVIDAGTGADATPIQSPWADILTDIGFGTLQRVSNKIKGRATGLTGSYRTDVLYSADCEFWVEIGTPPGAGDNNFIYSRIADPTLVNNFDGYSFMFGCDGGGVAFVQINRTTDASDFAIQTGLGGFNIPGGSWATGDRFGVMSIGTVFILWFVPAATGMAGLITQVAGDNTYNTSGRAILAMDGTTASVAKFGGGNLSGYSTEVLRDGPLAYYRLNETSGLPRDSSGNDNHMIFTNGTPTYVQPGAIASDPTDTAIRFDIASTESFAATDQLAPSYSDVFTLEAWVKRLSTSGAREEGIVTKGDNVGGLYFENNHLMLAKTSVGIIVQSTTTITDTASFHHLVATKNGATSKLYIDGVDVTGVVSDLTCSTDAAHGQEIGAEFGTSSPIDGIVDEVAVYGTALSAARVLAHYNAAAAAAGTLRSIAFMGAIGHG